MKYYINIWYDKNKMVRYEIYKIVNSSVNKVLMWC